MIFFLLLISSSKQDMRECSINAAAKKDIQFETKSIKKLKAHRLADKRGQSRHKPARSKTFSRIRK